MKFHGLTLSAVVLLLAGCGSGASQSTGPNVTVHLRQINTPHDIFYFAGPVNIQFALEVTNPTNEPVTLQRLELETIGPGAYYLRTGSTPINLTVKPNSTATTTLSAWGRSRGGYLTSTEPVTLRAVAYFSAPSGQFVKVIQENFMPQ